MCRSGRESAGTRQRRCVCSPSTRALYDTKRLVNRYARRLAAYDNADDTWNTWPLFLKHFERLQERTGLRLPPVPDIGFSRVEEFRDCSWMSDDMLEAAISETWNDPLAQIPLSDECARRDAELHEAERRAEERRMGELEAWLTEEARREERRAKDVWEIAADQQIDADDPVLNPAARTPRNAEAECRRSYDEYNECAYLQAEEACNGRLLNERGLAKGISARSLFEGPIHRAEAYASEELQAWWNTGHFPRLSYSAFRGQAFGWASDREARDRARTQEFMNVANVV